MRQLLIDNGLRAYRLVVASGLLNRPRPRRAFESSYLAYKLLVEAGPVERLRPWVPAGATVVDIGANIGFFAVRFGRWVGTDGTVLAVEPELRNVSSLSERLGRAGLDGVVEVVHAAVDKEPGTVMLEINPTHPGDHHLGETGVPVPAVTLDDLAAAHRPVALIKIDVQGAEVRVLQGATRVLAEDRPAIFIEIDNRSLQRFGATATELMALLSQAGYLGRELTRSGFGPPEAPEELGRRAADDYMDALFVSADRAEA
jgi:FkbM family methyltransferase